MILITFSNASDYWIEITIVFIIMIQLFIDRYNKAKDWTISRLFVDGIQHGYVIEDEVRNGPKVYGETAIPHGTYTIGIRQSPKFSATFLWSDSKNILVSARDKWKYPLVTDFRPHDLMWIKDVPGFEYILIHWGNTDDDTHGCLIVGETLGVIKGQEAVLNSRTFYVKLYQQIYPRLKNNEQGQIVINK